MFDNALGMATRCVEDFSGVVRDSFGASIITDVLEPILKELDSLRAFNEAFQQQAINIDRVLEDARTIQFMDCGRMR